MIIAGEEPYEVPRNVVKVVKKAAIQHEARVMNRYQRLEHDDGDVLTTMVRLSDIAQKLLWLP